MLSLLSPLAAFLLSLAATYTNPILHSDYSDPDVICVDGHYWMTSSSFNCVPGLQILHSTDLVNWDIVNAALPRMYGPVEASEAASEAGQVEHGNRVWAPSIRYFDGLYWIFWGDPDLGVFQTHAKHPMERWSDPVCVWSGKGIIDTCPLLDDDGRVYLVHGYAGSRAGFKSVLAVCEMDRECTRFTSPQIMIFDGNKSGDETIEGPKFYKRNGWYYVFAPAGGVKEGWQVVLRSRSPYGPYEYRNVMHQGNSSVHGPHQGGWVTDAAGDSWFLHFEDRYAWGRVVHLQPMKWLDDGWCTIGIDSNGDGVGEPVSEYRLPAAFPSTSGAPLRGFNGVDALSTQTNFGAYSIPLNWQWHAQPQEDWYLLNPTDGCLRLNCIQDAEGWNNLWDTGNLLLEKITGPEMELDAKLVFRPSYKGDRCGMLVMGLDYSTIEMEYDGEKVTLQRTLCKDADKGDKEIVGAKQPLALGRIMTSGHDKSSGKVLYATVHLKLKVEMKNKRNPSEGCVCNFYYSLDGRRFSQLGEPFLAREGRWIGAKAGFFATSKIKKNAGGSVEIY